MQHSFQSLFFILLSFSSVILVPFQLCTGPVRLSLLFPFQSMLKLYFTHVYQLGCVSGCFLRLKSQVSEGDIVCNIFHLLVMMDLLLLCMSINFLYFMCWTLHLMSFLVTVLALCHIILFLVVAYIKKVLKFSHDVDLVFLWHIILVQVAHVHLTQFRQVTFGWLSGFASKSLTYISSIWNNAKDGT